MKLLALSGMPSSAAATRFRLNALTPYLASLGIEVTVRPFLSQQQYARFYRASSVRRAGDVLAAIARNTLLACRSRRFDGVFVQREAAIVGPAIAEAWYGRRAPIVLDYDDSIWLSVHGPMVDLLRNGRKQRWLFERSAALIAGSEYLAKQGVRLADATKRVTVARTVVDTRVWVPRNGRLQGGFDQPSAPLIGWVGSHTTAPALWDIEPALLRLRRAGRAFRFRVVGGGSFRFKELEAEYEPWTMEREVDSFAEVDIGVAPMFDDLWSRGKCAFKQVQFMAVGVPMVSSRVGPPMEFMKHGQNGLLASTTDEWTEALERLLDDRELRVRLARGGRKMATEDLCIRVHGPRVANFIKDTLLDRA